MIEPTEFYANTEAPIRKLVKQLRDNGVNTTCSCGHKMYIEADISPDSMLYTIHKTVFNYLAENKMEVKYIITIRLEQNIAGLSRCFAHIQIGEETND